MIRSSFSVSMFSSCEAHERLLPVRQLLQSLPSKPMSNGYIQQKRLLSSPSSPKKEVLQSIKRFDIRNSDLNLHQPPELVTVLHFILSPQIQFIAVVAPLEDTM